MGRNEKKLFWICVIVAIALGLVAIAIALPRDTQVSFDYQGVYVAIFAALVALLIGWQIYNELGLSEKVEKSQKDVNESEEKIEQLKKELEREFERLSEMNYGLYYANIAVECYLQARLDVDKIDYSDYATSYVFAMRGLNLLLKSGASDDDGIYILVTGLMKNVISKFENGLQNDKETIKTAFDAEKHKKADNAFYAIAAFQKKLDTERWASIEEFHNRRKALQHECGL